MPETAVDLLRRRAMYSHPSSRRQEDERTNDRKPDPVTQLRAQHREELNDLGARHHNESKRLIVDRDAKRGANDQLRSGARPTQEWLVNEDQARRVVLERHAGERKKILDRHKREMESAAERQLAASK